MTRGVDLESEVVNTSVSRLGPQDLTSARFDDHEGGGGSISDVFETK
ncbi:MAG: hypothetical protein NXI04_15055 [Planctomycetaceae bacterium]|nr:hypothetical protein [Planctomycetaceae bacterium]